MTMNAEIEMMCARAAHEVNRAYCLALGDTSQVAWEQAPDWQRDSAFKGVALAIAGANPGDSHRSWLAEKEADGWKYGPVKNPETKEHPCFVPFEELPTVQKWKDVLFIRTVRTMASALQHSGLKDYSSTEWIGKKELSHIDCTGAIE